MQELQGILKGVSFDKIINEHEVRFLDEWMEKHSYLKRAWPYDELYSLVTQILQDGIITEDEETDILNFCQAICGDAKRSGSTDNLISLLKMNCYHIDPEITFPGNKFCITGISEKYKRRDIGERIAALGGNTVNTMSSLVNYLIVCANKSECWAFASYGRKVLTAMELRQQGNELLIVHENDLYDTFESFN